MTTSRSTFLPSPARLASTSPWFAPRTLVAVAACESEAIPDPDRLATAGPKWLYALPWWGEGKRHSAEWIRKTYPHEHLITRDELPQWRPSAP